MPCTLTLLPRTRRKSACVLLPTGRAPLDNVLEVLAMGGIVGSYLAAELEVPAVALSRLRHDCISDDGTCRRNGGDNDMLIWGIAKIASEWPPTNGLFNDRTDARRPTLWTYMTGVQWQDWHLQPGDVPAVAQATAEYLTTYKAPLVLVRYLSGLSTTDFAASLDLSRQRMHLIEGRDPKGDDLCSRYLALACRKHLQHLTTDSFWGERGSRIFPTETP